MKKGVAIAALAALPFFGMTYFSQQPKAQEQKVRAAKGAVPHYLENITQHDDEVDRIIEEAKVLNSYRRRFGRSSFANNNIAVVTSMFGKQVKIVFHNYEQKNDHVLHNDDLGFHKFSNDEFRLVKDDTVAYIQSAVREAYADHSQIAKRIIGIQEAQLKKTGRLKPDARLEDLLDKEVPGYPGLKHSDVLRVPRLSEASFTPDEIHRGPLPNGILGVTYLGSRLVGISPLAQQLDFVNKGPHILKHELTHSCDELQGIPSAFEFDVEFHASMVERDNAWWFLHHPYLEDQRSLAKVLFNLDAQAVLRRVIPVDLVIGTEINKDELRKYVGHIGRVRQVTREAYFDFLSEFYTHQPFWNAINEYMNDSNAAFKIYMWSRFQPTLLQGANNTYKWMQENKPVIEEASRKALENLKRDDPQEQSIIRLLNSLPREEKAVVMNYLKSHGLKDDEEAYRAMNVLRRLYTGGLSDKLRRPR